MGSQRVGYDLAAEQQYLCVCVCIHELTFLEKKVTFLFINHILLFLLSQLLVSS